MSKSPLRHPFGEPMPRAADHPSAYASASMAACRWMPRLAGLALAITSAGCAATQSQPSMVAGPTPRMVAVGKVEIEADGLPSQLAPRRRRPAPDDPSEPWSPNYGSARSAVPAPPLDTRRVAEKLAMAGPPSPRRVEVPVRQRPSSTRPTSARPTSTQSAAAQPASALGALPRQSVSRPLSANEIIRRAIAEHEMRHN